MRINTSSLPPHLIHFFSLLRWFHPSIYLFPFPLIISKPGVQHKHKKKMHSYGATCILIGPDVKMDATTEGVVVLVLLVVLGGVGGGVVVVVKSERGRGDDGDDVDEKVVKALSFSNGGMEEVDEEDDIANGSFNVKGGGG
jgi:hypothetical protein